MQRKQCSATQSAIATKQPSTGKDETLFTPSVTSAVTTLTLANSVHLFADRDLYLFDIQFHIWFNSDFVVICWFAHCLGIIVVVALKGKACFCFSLTINLLLNRIVALEL
jgi:hypothetical protein